MSRAERLDALNTLRSGVPLLSQSALSALLQIARHEELPRDYRREAIREARALVVRKMTPCGPLHQTLQVPLHSGPRPLDIE